MESCVHYFAIENIAATSSPTDGSTKFLFNVELISWTMDLADSFIAKSTGRGGLLYRISNFFASSKQKEATCAFDDNNPAVKRRLLVDDI